MLQSHDFKTMFSKAVGGDRQATERLLLQYAGHLRSRIDFRLPTALRSLVDADDVLQEVYIQAIRDIPMCQAESPEAFTAWLNAIADHRVAESVRYLNCQKRGGRMQRVGVPGLAPGSSGVDGLDGLSDSCATPGRVAATREAVAAIRQAVDQLPPDQREATRLHALEGQSLAEMARSVRRSRSAARGLVHRAKQRLRELLESSSRWFDKK